MREVILLDELESADAVLLYKVGDAVQVLNLSRSVVFDLLRMDRLRSVKEGRSRPFPAAALSECVGSAVPMDEPGETGLSEHAEGEPRPVGELRVLLTVEEAAAALAIGRTNMFKLIKTSQIASVRVGQLRRIPVKEIDAYVQRLMAESAA